MSDYNIILKYSKLFYTHNLITKSLISVYVAYVQNVDPLWLNKKSHINQIKNELFIYFFGETDHANTLNSIIFIIPSFKKILVPQPKIAGSDKKLLTQVAPSNKGSTGNRSGSDATSVNLGYRSFY